MPKYQQSLGVYQPYTLISPVGGWNTRDSVASMPESDAIVLDNMLPTPDGLISRKGHISFCAGLSSDVETLTEYHSLSTRKFIAASGGYIYDITTGSASALGSGYSLARWQTTNFNGHMSFVNGVDTPLDYDGSTLTTASWTGTGLSPTNLVGVHAYRNRLYFWENNTQDFWYGGTNSISGTLTKFPLSRVGQKGGNLVAIKSITRDGGNGTDDIIAFFMSSGAVIVYSGSDPGDATNWSLQGVYTIGEPLSIRSLVEIKGDVLVLTKADVISLLQMMQEGGFNNNPSKLSGAIAKAASLYGSNYGWQATLFPLGNLIIYNVPLVTGQKYHQYVTHTITNASCRYTGMNSNCWGVFNNELYFGGNKTVYKANTGLSDNGSNITVNAQQAFSLLGTGKKKRLSRYKPVLRAPGTLNLTSGIVFDYSDIIPTETSSIESDGSPWDTSSWDTSSWSSENSMIEQDLTAGGVGKAVSVKISASIKAMQLEWFRTDFAYVPLSSF